MQRLSATITVTPKGRIINSCTVDYRTVFMLIMETPVSKLTLSSLNHSHSLLWDDNTKYSDKKLSDRYH